MRGSQLAMRMLRDSSGADDASSTTPLLITPASSALMGSRPEGEGGSSSIYPDPNMVIILAALLCILICALGLNSVLRCARHCGRCLAMSATTTAPATTTTTVTRVVVVSAAPAIVSAGSGLDKRELRKIPVVEYETSKAGGGGVADADTTECAICLGEFVDGEKVRLLPSCRHGFHVSCIDMWLAAHSSCPVCRNSLLLPGEDDHGAGEATVVLGDEAT